jgi:hypothetical protein
LVGRGIATIRLSVWLDNAHAPWRETFVGLTISHAPLATADEVSRIGASIRCAAEYLPLAQSGHPNRLNQCPLLGVKRTSVVPSPMSAFDPKRTLPLRRSGGLMSHTRAASAC